MKIINNKQMDVPLNHNVGRFWMEVWNRMFPQGVIWTCDNALYLELDQEGAL